MNEHDDADWLDRARRRLQRSTEELDPDTLRRLRQARAAALGQADRKAPTRWMPWGGAALAASLALAVLLWQPWAGPPESPAALEDLELLAAEENLELYEELEFYLWLESEGLPEESGGAEDGDRA